MRKIELTEEEYRALLYHLDMFVGTFEQRFKEQTNYYQHLLNLRRKVASA